MNKEEAIDRDLQTKQFIEKNKIRALFSQLTRQILLSRPENPIEYLINHLQRRNKRSIICFQGYEEEKRTKLATSLSNKFNFHLINLSALLGGENFYCKSNAQISKKAIEEIKKVDKVYKGIIISGFPNNAAQADALQKAGIIPERYFLLHNNEPEVRNSYLKKCTEEEAQLLMDRNLLELKELKQLLRDQADTLPCSFDKALEKVNATISIRFKKNTPLEAPRIVVLHPPFLVPKSLHTLVDKYSLHYVSLQSSFKKACKKQEFKKYVASHIRQHKCLSKELELALIETESKTSAAKNKGLLVCGWPSKRQSVPFLKQHFLNPHLILVFTSIREKAVEQFNNLEADSEIFSIYEKPSVESYKADFKEYEQVVESLKGQANCQFMSIGESENHVIKTFESQIENPKIYS